MLNPSTRKIVLFIKSTLQKTLRIAIRRGPADRQSTGDENDDQQITIGVVVVKAGKDDRGSGLAFDISHRIGR